MHLQLQGLPKGADGLNQSWLDGHSDIPGVSQLLSLCFSLQDSSCRSIDPLPSIR